MTNNSDQVVQVLNRVPLLVGLKDNSKALLELSQIMEVRTYKAGATLLNEGDLGNEFFVLIHGQVSVFKKTPDGDVYRVVILKQEMTPAFGEGGLIEPEPRSATIKADLDSECLVLTQEKFQNFCLKNPEWAVPILKKLALNLMGSLRKTSNDLMLLHKALMNEIRS